VESADQSGATAPNADLRRSTMNIEMWSTYLPADCIETMIRMGWDKTT
jgi:hypothetical protein